MPVIYNFAGKKKAVDMIYFILGVTIASASFCGFSSNKIRGKFKKFVPKGNLFFRTSYYRSVQDSHIHFVKC